MPTDINITLFALNPIKIDGKKFFNENFTCHDEAHAAELVAVGSAKYADDQAAEKEDDKSESTVSAERIELVKDAILKLDPGTKNHWDKDGSPAVKALSKVAESVIQKEERDFVWALVNG